MKTNKLKDYLRLKMLGQLSDFNTELDVDNAYGVCKDFSVSFKLFCRATKLEVKKFAELENNPYICKRGTSPQTIEIKDIL